MLGSIGILLLLVGLVWGTYGALSESSRRVMVGMSLMIFGVLPLFASHVIETNQQKLACRTAGGTPIIGDRGHFKACLADGSMLELK